VKQERVYRNIRGKIKIVANETITEEITHD
jgi:hypothetical protein